jgi:hypothetical protein
VGFWSNLFSPSVRTDVKSVARSINRACQDRMCGRIRQFGREQDPDRALDLINPRDFAGFARQACEDTSRIVLRTLQEMHREAAAAGGSQVAPRCSVTADQVFSHLAPHLNDVMRVLEAYAQVYHRFRQIAASARGGLIHRCAESGWNGAELGDALFGPIGAIGGALLGSFLAGRAAGHEIAPEAERLDRALGSVIEAWDAAMTGMTKAALDMIGEYVEGVFGAGA